MADKRNTVRRIDAPETENPDAITGAPGSHPVGTGIGAAATGAAGAAIGSVIPGAGTVVGGAVGAVVGAIAGGLAGKGVAEAINPTSEDEYWRNNYADRPYVAPGAPYDEYATAYRYGYTAASQLPVVGQFGGADILVCLGTMYSSARIGRRILRPMADRNVCPTQNSN